MMVGIHRIFRMPGKPDAIFNTLKSDQILGFIETQNGVYISLEPRKPDVALEAAAPQRILNESEHKLNQYLRKVEEEKNKSSASRSTLYTMNEVSKHNSRENGVWFVIDGKVYDASPWLRDHPGGADVLVRAGGKDVTKMFKSTNHSSFAVQEASIYQIGVLVASSKL